MKSEGSSARTRATVEAESGGRPVVQVWGTRGMASSMHPLASEAALDALRAGGNAVDAAVALGAAIAVTSPDWAGPAGDSAWLVYLADTGEFHYLDGYSTCPAAIDAERLAQRFGLERARDARAFAEEPPDRRHVGVVTSMVPGTPAAWVALASRFGRLGIDRVLHPAVRIAERGFPVNEYFGLALAAHAGKVSRFESTRSIFCGDDGAVLRQGARLRQPELAGVLRAMGERGHEGFYAGTTADRIVEHCRAHGGTITHEDLARYRVAWRDVLKGSYRGTGVVVTAPPTAGVHVLQALAILEAFDLAELPYHGPKSLHLLIEVLKLALADRRALGGDPDHAPMDVGRLLSSDHLARLRARIDPERAATEGLEVFPGGSTTHFCVRDEAGNMVSATQSVGAAFGCGEVVAGTGLLMNDRTWWMSLDEGPNRVAPLRRANIGHAPTMLLRDGVPFASLGSPGGFGIVQYVVQVAVNMLDYGLDIQRAIEAPRFRIEDLRGTVAIESRIDASTRGALAAKGHSVVELPAWTDRVGGVEGIVVDPGSGSMQGGYDPRRNSLAAGLD